MRRSGRSGRARLLGTRRRIGIRVQTRGSGRMHGSRADCLQRCSRAMRSCSRISCTVTLLSCTSRALCSSQLPSLSGSCVSDSRK
eukprot:scaffold31941_cov63-Phaeocystis_antarctica.AAC.5